MKTLSKLLTSLIVAMVGLALFMVGLAARLAWKLIKALAAYLAVRHIARTQIRKALT